MGFTTNFSIQIQTPCDKNWGEMLPDEKGRFCLHCSKQVTDFTQLTDAEIIDFFENKKNSSHQVCGRFLNTQLNRVISPPPVKSNVHNSPFAKLFNLLLPVIITSKAVAIDDIAIRDSIIPAKPDTIQMDTVSSDRIIIDSINTETDSIDTSLKINIDKKKYDYKSIEFSTISGNIVTYGFTTIEPTIPECNPKPIQADIYLRKFQHYFTNILSVITIQLKSEELKSLFFKSINEPLNKPPKIKQQLFAILQNGFKQLRKRRS